MRELSYSQAINAALGQCLDADPSVYVIGLGVPGPTGIFGTTSGLAERFGAHRVMDMPSSEAGMTGVALGTTIAGFRPIMVHMRVDFAILAMDQMVNQVAKWHFMYGGNLRAPMVFRMIIGRGWGQGPQHSQSLHAWFSHIPGFKVAMPATPHDVKGMLISAVRDDAPVAIFEHRWLYGIKGDVPEESYEVPLGSARIVREGRDVTIAATSYMVLEAIRAAEVLKAAGVEAEVVDVRSLVPLDLSRIAGSVEKCGAVVVADTGALAYGASAEILAGIVEKAGGALRYPPKRIGLPFSPSPTSPSLADAFYPRAYDIVSAVAAMLDLDTSRIPPEPPSPERWRDKPDASFTGPY